MTTAHRAPGRRTARVLALTGALLLPVWLGGCDTVRCLHASGVAYECRTNWHAGLFSVDDLFALADALADAGVAHWAL